jgi:hypothetical protein
VKLKDCDLRMRVPIRVLALATVVGAVLGCGGGSGSGGGAAAPTTSTTTQTVNYVPPNADIGIPTEMSTDDKPYKALVASTVRFKPRTDPFQLTSEESAYDRQQNVERMVGSMGGFTNQYTVPPDETKEIPAEEPQPYRRLAGIVVGDSVLAIIDMGDGHAGTIIRPGMKIPNTEWTVVSIDQDKAVLHRDGPVGPHTITVRLESPPSFGGGTGFTSGPQQGGMGPGGPPPGRGRGFPGGPGVQK